MAYKVKKKRAKKLKPEYFRERDIASIRKKYKGKVPPYKVLAKTGIKRTEGFYKRVYEKGRVIKYKDKIARVEKVTRQGIHIRIIKKDKQGFPTKPSKKLKFVSVEEVRKGNVRPFFTRLPLLIFTAPLTIET
jgi:hypothetical protein